MSLKIRLSRGGAKKRPFYRIVVADSRMPRDGRFVERLGTFDPLKAKDAADRVVLDAEKAKEWLAKGAQPSDRVLRLLDGLGVAKRDARQQSRQGQAEEEGAGARRRRGRRGREGRRRGISATLSRRERVAAEQRVRGFDACRADCIPGHRVSTKRTSSPGSTSSSNPLPPGEGTANLILVGRFGAPQGVRGQVRVQSFTADPLALTDYGPLSDGGARDFALSDVRLLRNTMLVASVAGVPDRDAAAALTGTDLFARRENLPAPDEDEVYVADLIGIDAVDEAGAFVGRIVDVPNYGAGDILELRPPAGETLLVPFTKAFVPVVDLASRRVVVIVPPDGDDEAAPDSA